MALDPFLLRNALAKLSRPIPAAEAEAVFGGGTAGRVALAQALAGTSDKKARAYKSAMRSLQRYGAAEGKQRRAMGAKMRPLITKAAQARRAAERLDRPITVRWKGPTIKVSSTVRQRPDVVVSLDPEQLEEVREALEANDDQAAIDALAEASLAAWFTYDRADALMTDAAGLSIRRET